MDGGGSYTITRAEGADTSGDGRATHAGCVDVHLSNEGAMDEVTISPDFEVVIPPAVRERLRLQPGQKVRVIVYEDQIVLVPVRHARELRGFVRGMNTDFERDGDRV